jgi:hypothetical protein
MSLADPKYAVSNPAVKRVRELGYSLALPLLSNAVNVQHTQRVLRASLV